MGPLLLLGCCLFTLLIVPVSLFLVTFAFRHSCKLVGLERPSVLVAAGILFVNFLALGLMDAVLLEVVTAVGAACPPPSTRRCCGCGSGRRSRCGSSTGCSSTRSPPPSGWSCSSRSREPMTGYFATCARGLEQVLADELTALGAADVARGRGGVTFRGEPALLYRANLWLRTAVRVLRPVLEADVRSPDELYDAVRTVDWAEHLTPDHTLAVDANVRDTAGITHSQYASRRVKDAICDQFREKLGVRPSVDPDRPMVGFNLHVSRDHAVLSLDSSWDSLHKRGYRPIQTRAPLNEALAAGLLLAAGWDRTTPLADPLCGSGTFPIEASWLALSRPPGLTRRWFGFMGWPSFDRGLWAAIRDDARDGVRKELPAAVVGSDVRRDAIEFARTNARTAGVGHLVRFDRVDVLDARPPAGPPGTLVCNPPYGERIGDEEELFGLYRAIGEAAEKHWKGWRVLLFTSNDQLARAVPLQVKKQLQFFNGKLMCKLWEYWN